jgi:hypothetical protein
MAVSGARMEGELRRGLRMAYELGAVAYHAGKPVPDGAEERAWNGCDETEAWLDGYGDAMAAELTPPDPTPAGGGQTQNPKGIIMETSMPPVGPRMAELCRILDNMGGTAEAQSHVYLQLDYRGTSSNRFGSAAMDRAMRAGLIEVDREAALDAPGNRLPVRLTAAGRAVAS